MIPFLSKTKKIPVQDTQVCCVREAVRVEDVGRLAGTNRARLGER